MLSYLKTNLWTPVGVRAFSVDGNFFRRMSAFVTGHEANARFAVDDTANAIALIHLMWDRMVDPANPFYTGTLWEYTDENGAVENGFVSLSHGWASGPTAALSNYVLGVQSVTPGFRTWAVRPQPGNLTWAQGQVPTPSGSLVVRWAQDAASRQMTLRVEAPAGTSGSVSLPAAAGVPVFQDGQKVWDGTQPLIAGVNQVGAYIQIDGVSGAHTFNTVSIQ